MENKNILDPAAMYGIPPCAASGVESNAEARAPVLTEEELEAIPAQTQPSPPPTSAGAVPENIDFSNIPENPNLPSLQDIASYNFLTAQERQRQRMQLQQSGAQQLPYLLNGAMNAPSTQYSAQPLTSNAPTLNELQGTVPGGSISGTGSPDLTRVPPGSSSGPQPGTMAAIPPSSRPISIPSESLQYMNGFLRTQIGRIVMVQFLVGTNTLVDKMGILLAVGVNYILINETETDDILACDFYNIKFVKFYY